MTGRAITIGGFFAVLFLLPGCANFYTYVSAAPIDSAQITIHDQIIAIELTRKVAQEFDLHEVRYPSSPRMPSESQEGPTEYLTEFWNSTVWIQFSYPGYYAPIDFRIGELGTWNESERARSIRDALLSSVDQHLPHFKAIVTTKRDVLPFGP
jgi:hypothetical protein